MMIHEKILSGQFLVDFKNDHSSLLHVPHPHQPLHLHHLQQPLLPQMSSAPLDIYSAYNLQQLMGGSASFHKLQHQSKACENNATTEVLDLSRRYDSHQEARRKTPSPYNQSSSSNGYNTPATSPIGDYPHQQHQPVPVHHPFASQGDQAHSLHPILPYVNLKKETISPPPIMNTTSITCNQPVTVSPSTNPIPKLPITTPTTNHDAIRSPISTSPNQPSTTPNADNRHTPILPLSSPATLPETKSAPRPFKAFPRDPLVIAATFAATDVLLDNPRVERYTEYRKRVLEQIRTSNGGTRTVTNPKMRRVNSRNGSVHDGSSSNHNSESDERNAAEESSDCDSSAGNFEKFTTRTSSHNEAAAAVQDTANSAVGNSASQVKDAAYYERRRKNNAAAKKSRDRRRIKEDEIAIRAAYLERQNIELLCQIDALKAQLATFISKNCP